MSEKIENGTVVQLKSGGPLMTIDSYDEDRQQYYCEWFVKEQRQAGYFSGTSIQKYEPISW